MDDVPAPETVEFLPPSEESRFSMLIGYANGEMRRYDALANPLYLFDQKND